MKRMPTPEQIVEGMNALGYEVRNFLEQRPEADEAFCNNERKEILEKMKLFVRELRKALRDTEQTLTSAEYQLDDEQKQNLEDIKAEAESYIKELMPLLDNIYDKFSEFNKKIGQFFADKDMNRELYPNDKMKKSAQGITSTKTPAGDGLPHGPRGGRYQGGKGFKKIR